MVLKVKDRQSVFFSFQKKLPVLSEKMHYIDFPFVLQYEDTFPLKDAVIRVHLPENSLPLKAAVIRITFFQV